MILQLPAGGKQKPAPKVPGGAKTIAGQL